MEDRVKGRGLEQREYKILWGGDGGEERVKWRGESIES